MTLLGAYRLAKALKGPSKEEKQRLLAKYLEGDHRRFFKHVDTCGKTNSGKKCRTCHRLAGAAHWGHLDSYTQKIRESPESTIKPFNDYLAEHEAKVARIDAIEKALTDKDFEEFGLRVFREIDIELGTDYEFVAKAAGRSGSPSFLVFIKGSFKYVVPTKLDWDREDFVSGIPWKSASNDLDGLWMDKFDPLIAIQYWKEEADFQPVVYCEVDKKSEQTTTIKLYGRNGYLTTCNITYGDGRMVESVRFSRDSG